MVEMLTEMMMGLSSKNMSEYIKVVVKSKIVGHHELREAARAGGALRRVHDKKKSTTTTALDIRQPAAVRQSISYFAILIFVVGF